MFHINTSRSFAQQFTKPHLTLQTTLTVPDNVRCLKTRILRDVTPILPIVTPYLFNTCMPNLTLNLLAIFTHPTALAALVLQPPESLPTVTALDGHRSSNGGVNSPDILTTAQQ